MSFSRDRQEAAEQLVADAVKADRVSPDCMGCAATRDMSRAAIDTGCGSEIDGAIRVGGSYVTVIAGCVGPEACKGVAFIQPAQHTQ